MQKSVLMVDRVPHAVFNGVTRYMDQIAAQAPDYASQIRFEMLFWGLRIPPQTWRKLGEYRRQPPAVLASFNRKFLYPWAERRSDADLLHFPAHGIPSDWLKSTRKYLLSVHGAAAQIAPQWDTQPQRSAKLREMLAAAKDRECSFVTFSHFARNQIIEHYRLPHDRIEVIPHGVDHTRFRPCTNAEVSTFRKRASLEKPYILYIGPCALRKNVGKMIEAFAQLKRRQDTPHEFIIAGRWHPGQDDVRKQVEVLGISGSVRFLSTVDDADLPLLYSGADMFAFVSLYEGFGLPVLEAMACGTPVITNAGTATGEVARDAAKLVQDPADAGEIAAAMESLLGSEDERQQMATDGMERARDFTWAKSAERHFSLYQTIIGG